VSHIEDAVNSLSVELTAEEVASLEELYVPRRVSGPILEYIIIYIFFFFLLFFFETIYVSGYFVFS
jgi:hypothetical protein